MKELFRTIGCNIEAIITEKKISVDEFAQSLKVPTSTIYKILGGRKILNEDELNLIGKTLSVPVENLLTPKSPGPVCLSAQYMGEFKNAEKANQIFDMIDEYMFSMELLEA